METCKLARYKVGRSVVLHGKGSATYFEILVVATLSLYELICLLILDLAYAHYIIYEIFLLYSSVLLVYTKTVSFCFGKGFYCINS